MVRKHIMKHKCTRALIVAILTCSFSLGSFPASVGAWQLSRAIERAQMGYNGNSVSYASDNGNGEDDDVADESYGIETQKNERSKQKNLSGGGFFQ